MARLFVVQFPKTRIFSLEDQEKPFRSFFKRYFKRYDEYCDSVAEGRPDEKLRVSGRFECRVEVEDEDFVFLLRPRERASSKTADYVFLKLGDLCRIQSPMPEEELRRMAKEVETFAGDATHNSHTSEAMGGTHEPGASKQDGAKSQPAAATRSASVAAPGPAAGARQHSPAPAGPAEQEKGPQGRAGFQPADGGDGPVTPGSNVGTGAGRPVPLARAGSAPAMHAALDLDTLQSGAPSTSETAVDDSQADEATAAAGGEERGDDGGGGGGGGAGPSADLALSAATAAATAMTEGEVKRDDEAEVAEGEEVKEGGTGGTSARRTGVAKAEQASSKPKLELVVDVEQGMRDMLRFLDVHGAVWIQDTSGDRMQVTFPSPLHRNEKVLRALQRFGLGHLFGAVTIAPLDIAKISREPQEATDVAEETAKFLASTKSRLVMFDQMVSKVLEGAELSFDFIALAVVASLLAGVGLLSNNTVIIVASMLVSPIMGPVMGVTFGATIRDWSMVRTGIVSGIAGLGCCVLVGIALGLVAVGVDVEGIPTSEMKSRGEWIGLPIGLSIAIPSGVGVALSVAGQNTGSLVGVAISASLLPPAVNAGILWVYAALGRESEDGSVDSAEFAEQGVVSMLLTLLNILCIFVFAMAMFELKELGRIKSATLYWRPEVKLRREMGYSRALGQNRHQRFVTYLDMLGEKELKERLQSSRSHRELEGKEAAPSLFIGKQGLQGLFDPLKADGGAIRTPIVPYAEAGVASTARHRAHKRYKSVQLHRRVLSEEFKMAVGGSTAGTGE